MKPAPSNLFLLAAATFVVISSASAAITTPFVKNTSSTDIADTAASAWTFGGAPAAAAPTSTDIVVLNGNSPTGTLISPLSVSTGVTWKQLWIGQDGSTSPNVLSAPTADVFLTGSKITLNNTADSAPATDGYGFRNASHKNVIIGNDIAFTGTTRGTISAEGNGTVTLNGPITFAATGTGILLFRAQGSGYIAGTTGAGGVITVNGNISATGTGNVQVTDGKTVVLSGNNTFGGTVTLSSGIMLAGSDTAYGTGTINFAGGGIGSKDSTAHSFTNALTFTANATIGQTTGGTGAVSLSGAAALGTAVRTITTNANTTLSGIISGTGGITKAGAATLMLSAANTYTGATTVNAGILAAGTNTSFGTGALTFSGGTIASSDATARTFANALTISVSTNVTFGTAATGNLIFSGVALGGTDKLITVNNTLTEFAGAIGGTTSTVTKTGSGTLLLSGTNAATKSFKVSAGTLAAASGIIGAGGSTLTMDGGAFQWNGANTQDISSSVIMMAAKTAAFDTNGNNVTFASAIGSSTTAALTKLGNGTLTLGGINTYTGNTTVTGGTLSLAAATLGDISTVSIASGAILNLNHSATDAVATLVVNGVQQADGLYKSSTGSGAGTVLSSLSGSGKLKVGAIVITYAGWASDNGLTVGVNDAKADNSDNDGLNNLGEFAFDGDPLSGKSDGKIVSKIAVINGDRVLTLTLPVFAEATFIGLGPLFSSPINGVTYLIECSDTLGSFDLPVEEVTNPTDRAAIQGTLAVDHPLTPGWGYRTFRISGSVTDLSKQFLRARVTE